MASRRGAAISIYPGRSSGLRIAYLPCIQFRNVAEILGFPIVAQVLNEPICSKKIKYFKMLSHHAREKGCGMKIASWSPGSAVSGEAAN
jgi:hypothetical protein